MSSKKKKKKKKETKRYETSDGKKFKDKDDAREHAKDLKNKGSSSSGGSSSSSSKTPTVNYTYDSKKETADQYNKRIEKERAIQPYSSNKDDEKKDEKKYRHVTKNGTVYYSNRPPREGEEERDKDEDKVKDEEKPEKYDDSGLLNSEEYKRLPKDQQEVLREMLGVISGNDQKKAVRLIESFKAMQKINDPYFAQQLGLAIDGIKRGYVAIDKQAQFEEQQMSTRLKDLKEDYEAKKGFMSLEQAQVMKDIQAGYEQNLDTLQTGLAEAGFTSSSRRVQKEGILNEATGDLRESKNRAFAYEQNTLDETLQRGERDTEKELARLSELTKAGKLDFLRNAEQQIGSDALGDLNLSGAPNELGGIYGSINQDKLQDTISSMSSFVF